MKVYIVLIAKLRYYFFSTHRKTQLEVAGMDHWTLRYYDDTFNSHWGVDGRRRIAIMRQLIGHLLRKTGPYEDFWHSISMIIFQCASIIGYTECVHSFL